MEMVDLYTQILVTAIWLLVMLTL